MSVNFYKNIDRTASLMRLIPGLFDMDCLYVGARVDRMDYYKDFKKQPTIIEAWEPNVHHLNGLDYNVLLGDIVTFEFLSFEKYEVVMWWHGPEHIKHEELQPTLEKIEKVATKAVVLGCPWRGVEQGEIHNNPYEKHLSFLDYEDFESYQVECLGNIDDKGSNITAVKWI